VKEIRELRKKMNDLEKILRKELLKIPILGKILIKLFLKGM